MILDSTTKSVELILGAAATANAMPVTVDYVDLTTTTTLAGSSDTQSNGTTAVTIVAAPAASTQRKVNAVTVFNADTASKVVTIRLNNNATLRNLISVTLQVGDTIGYSDTSGWYLLDSDGNLKSVQAASATSIATAIHGATDKATPVGTDEFGIWDSVTGLLNRVSFTNALSWFAAKLGNASNVFSVAAATAAAHAVRSDQLSSDNTNFPIYTTHTAWTPTVTPSAGSITTYSASATQVKIGKQVFGYLTITLTNVGTASGLLSVSGLPVANNASFYGTGVGKEVATTAQIISASIAPTSSTILLDGAAGGNSLWVSGYVLVVSYSYFTA